MDLPNDILDAENELLVPEIVVEGGKQLLNLSDKCLIEIFRRLRLDDLSSVGLTCVRLRDIARQTFCIKPKKRVVVVDYMHFAFRPKPMEKIERVFQCLGDLIVEVKFTREGLGCRYEREVMDFVEKYCRNGSMEEWPDYRELQLRDERWINHPKIYH